MPTNWIRSLRALNKKFSSAKLESFSYIFTFCSEENGPLFSNYFSSQGRFQLCVFNCGMASFLAKPNHHSLKGLRSETLSLFHH